MHPHAPTGVHPFAIMRIARLPGVLTHTWLDAACQILADELSYDWVVAALYWGDVASDRVVVGLVGGATSEKGCRPILAIEQWCNHPPAAVAPLLFGPDQGRIVYVEQTARETTALHIRINFGHVPIVCAIQASHEALRWSGPILQHYVAVGELIAHRLTPLIEFKPGGQLVLVTQREHEVLQALSRGSTVSEIGSQLGISPHTVHDHIKSMHTKLGASTRGGLVARYAGLQTH